MTPQSRADLTAHMAGCDRCRESWQRHRSLGYGPPETDPSTPSEPPCPHPADVGALVRDRLDPDAGRTTRIHILGCPQCYAHLDAALYEQRRRRREDAAPTDDTEGGGAMRRWLRRFRGGRG